MIYLVHNGNHKLRIGYTTDVRTLEITKKDYESHNPRSEFIDINYYACLESDIYALRILLKKYNISGYWYNDCEDARKIWEDFKNQCKERDTEVKNEINSEY